MKGIKDFIVHIPVKYKDKFKTDSGLELYGDSRWSPKELANTITKVLEVPAGYHSPVMKGFEILIDPTVIFQQIYAIGGKADSHYLVDRERNLYRINPSMIILYRDNSNSPWTGFQDNILVERIPAERKTDTSSLIISPGSSIPKEEKGKAKLIIGNKDLEEMGIYPGDIIFVWELMAVDYFLNDKRYVWFRNKDIFGVEPKKETA